MLLVGEQSLSLTSKTMSVMRGGPSRRPQGGQQPMNRFEARLVSPPSLMERITQQAWSMQCQVRRQRPEIAPSFAPDTSSRSTQRPSNNILPYVAQDMSPPGQRPRERLETSTETGAVRRLLPRGLIGQWSNIPPSYWNGTAKRRRDNGGPLHWALRPPPFPMVQEGSIGRGFS
jgi:hypothetical protein